MAREVITVTDEVFPFGMGRAAGERAAYEAGAAAELQRLPMFQKLLGEWRTRGRAARLSLHSGKADDFVSHQMTVRLSHIFDDVLADIADMGRRGLLAVQIDEEGKVDVGLPAKGRDVATAAALVSEGQAIADMLRHPGWAPFMRQLYIRAGAHLLALETCAVAERAYHSAAIMRLLTPVKALHEAVRQGLAAEAWLQEKDAEESGRQRGD